MGFLGNIRRDYRAVFQRDPAAKNGLEVILAYPGFHAIFWHRINHMLWELGVPVVPRLLSHIARFLTGIEIHPAAKIEGGFFIDHGFGVVIGETSEVGKNVTMYQGTTLGGTGKEMGKRHPTVGDNVVIGAGAKILGAIKVGRDTRIGANAVVVKDVQPGMVVVGVPGKPVERQGPAPSSHHPDLQHGNLPDIVSERLDRVLERLDRIEQRMYPVIQEPTVPVYVPELEPDYTI